VHPLTLRKGSQLQAHTIKLDGRDVRVATTPVAPGRIPLLLFNGIGANLDLVRPFADVMAEHGVGIVIFDVPGIGGSDPPALPYRLPWLARFTTRVLASLGFEGPVDVAGVSWGGTIAQEFAHRYPERVRHLLLAATSAGSVALPGDARVLAKLANPRRYADKDYMLKIGGELYGGRLRREPELLAEYAKYLKPPKGPGYLYQLLAAVGWTSALWLRTLKMPALVMMGTDDPIMPVVNGRFLSSMIPNAHLFTIDDGHLFLLVRARECAPIIESFLRRP
jgi:poly(3-hydroxyalkanoate) depolymerase